MTGALTALLICAAGGVGAALRFVIDGAVRARLRSTYPVATSVINITGSLLLGVVIGLTGSELPSAWLLIAGTGLLGGYTTFSTASFETVRLLEDGRYLAAAVNSIGMLIASVTAAGLGLVFGLAV
ncbi:MAG TPA: CrcB family protein [Propionibacteriaceae bacterium]|nr:CrcB family protein [Propionibacteriaceae bacterium]